MTKPLISVIIPVYNVIEYLEQCLQSVQKQTYTNLEILLVDDGSSDGSERICDAYAEADSRFRVIHQKNAGASTARNRGMDEATGEFLAFLDSDDWLEPDAYECLQKTQEREQADIVWALGKRMFRTELNVKPKETCTVLEGKDILDTYILDERKDPPVQKALWDKLYRRSVIGELRLPERIITGEDGVFNTKVFCRAKKAVFLSHVIYHYRDERPGNISGTRITDRIFADRIPAMTEQIADLEAVGRTDLARDRILAFYRELQRLYYKTWCSSNPRKKEILKELKAYYKGEKQRIRQSYHYPRASIGYRIKTESFLYVPLLYCIYMKQKESKKQR